MAHSLGTESPRLEFKDFESCEVLLFGTQDEACSVVAPQPYM